MQTFRRPYRWLAPLLLALAAFVVSGCALPSALQGVPSPTPAPPADRPSGQTQPQAPLVATPDAPPLAAPTADAGLSGLLAQQQAFEALYARARPAVVQIVVRASVLPPDLQIPDWLQGLPGFEFDPGQFQRSGQGSGFVLDGQGHIVTNYHVVAGAEAIQVQFSDDTTALATLVGRDPFSDLAVLRVETLPAGVAPLTLATSSTLGVGQIVVAIGNPFGLTGSMSTGIISGLGRDLPTEGSGFQVPGVIQTDAAINPGNSGGPLLNLAGEVIGVNTAIASPSGASAGVGFAVPVDIVARVIPALIAEGVYRYPWLGAELVSLNALQAAELGLAATSGAIVLRVTPGGPADQAGLVGMGVARGADGEVQHRAGDVVVAVNGQPVASGDAVIREVLRQPVGGTLTLTVQRDGQQRDVVVTLGERPLGQG